MNKQPVVFHENEPPLVHNEFYWRRQNMLRDFSHYVFSFHDQFVEALSAGIWLERVDESSDGRRRMG